jgi:hypothetical protein
MKRPGRFQRIGIKSQNKFSVSKRPRTVHFNTSKTLSGVKVTHLLCLGDEETDKMKYAEKFNKQREAKIWLVWEEWFWDSVVEVFRSLEENNGGQIIIKFTSRRCAPLYLL